MICLDTNVLMMSKECVSKNEDPLYRQGGSTVSTMQEYGSTVSIRRGKGQARADMG